MASTSVPAGWLMSVSDTGGPHAGLERAFARHGRSLYRYFVVRSGGDAHQADDLMQQLWLHAKRTTRAIGEGEVEYWLRALARNLIRNHWRKQAAMRRNVPLVDPTLAAELAERIATEDLSSEYLLRKEIRDQLILAVTELGTADQELIVSYYFQGEPRTSLAARLRLSERAVEGRLYRARRTLRAKLQNLEM